MTLRLFTTLLPLVVALTTQAGQVRNAGNAPGISRAGTKVAIIPGEEPRAPAESALAQVEAAVSKSAAVELVERGEIRRILAEQKLTTANLVQSGQTVKLGQLLAAELLLFVEQLPDGQPAAWRVQVIETRTGISLGGVIGAEQSLAAEPAPIIAALKSAMAKARVAPEERHYLGILGVRSEELNRSLDGLAESFAMFLALDLGESPEVVVLDRERLEHLQAEAALTGNELALRTSALLLEGGVKHGESRKELHFTFSLRRLGEKTGPTVRVVGPADNAKEARRLLAQAILRQCNVAVREQPAADAKSEAAAFSERAAILGAHREREAAARCAEAAATLFPSPENRWQAAEAWLFVPGSDAVQAHKAALHFWELQQQFLDEHLARWRSLPAAPIQLPLVPNAHVAMRPLQIELNQASPELRSLRKELQQVCRSFYHLVRNYDAARWEERLPDSEGDPQRQWSWMAAQYVDWFDYWSDDVRDWARLIREAAEQIDAPAGKQAVETPSWMQWKPGFNQTYFFLRLVEHVPRFTAPEEVSAVMDCYETLARSTDARVRLAAVAARVNFIAHRVKRPNIPTAIAGLEAFVRYLPARHPARREMKDQWFPPGQSWRCSRR